MKYAILFIVPILFSAFKSSTTSNDMIYEGVAKDMETQELIYREIHKEIYDEKEHIITQTNFVNAKNQLIAKRTLDFSKSKTQPHYTLNDYRMGLKEEVSNQNGNFTIVYQENSQAPLIRKEIKVPEPAIVDGGFNFFVKQKWALLLNGGTAHFNYVSTERQAYYRFQISISEINENKGTVIIKMEPVNYFLRVLLDPILITYNRETRRIIDYKGISNIKNKDGDNHIAVLNYPTVGP